MYSRDLYRGWAQMWRGLDTLSDVASIVLKLHLALAGVFPHDSNTGFTLATTVSALLL